MTRPAGGGSALSGGAAAARPRGTGRAVAPVNASMNSANEIGPTSGSRPSSCSCQNRSRPLRAESSTDATSRLNASGPRPRAAPKICSRRAASINASRPKPSAAERTDVMRQLASP
jgi:hypothetical protein